MNRNVAAMTRAGDATGTSMLNHDLPRGSSGPTLFVAGEMDFGDDRLDFVQEALGA